MLSKISLPAAIVLAVTLAATCAAYYFKANEMILVLLPLVGVVVQAFMRAIDDPGQKPPTDPKQ